MKHFIWIMTKLAMGVALIVTPFCSAQLWDRALGFPAPEDRLIIASGSADHESFDQMLARGVSANARDQSGLTPLIAACRSNRMSLAKQLIDLGADVNAADNVGMTPLMYAAQFELIDMMHLLLARGADPCRLNNLGQGARAIALNNERYDAAQLLKPYETHGSNSVSHRSCRAAP